MDWAAIGSSLIRGRIVRALQTMVTFHRNRNIGVRTYRFLHARQRVQPVNAIVHTKRDARLLREAFGLSNVDHHPLSFIAAAEAVRIRQAATRDQFPLLLTLPPDAKLIGSFGFLSPYKGFETALRALHYLPEDHHLLIFGGVHPQAIKREQELDPVHPDVAR